MRMLHSRSPPAARCLVTPAFRPLLGVWRLLLAAGDAPHVLLTTASIREAIRELSNQRAIAVKFMVVSTMGALAH